MTAIDFDRGILHVGPTKFLHPKSEKSIGDVDLDEGAVSLLQGFHAKRQSNFVLESEIVPRLSAGYSHYRAEKTFQRLSAWLRSHGVTSRTPMHQLRKLFGSLICDQFGIYAASRALRHADVSITAKHYVARRAKVTVQLGAMLSNKDKVIELPKENAEPTSLKAAI